MQPTLTIEPVADCESGMDSSSRPLTKYRSQAIILGVALLTRLLALWSVLSRHPKDWLYSHPYEMGLVANSLVHGHGYSSPFGGSTGPTAFIAPGYPTLIAGIFLLFGTFTFASVVAIMAMQILVSLVTIWLMMTVARRFGGTRAANIAGVFWAVSLPLLWIPAIFWETSFSACLVIGMIALVIRCERTPSHAMWILFGSLSAIAALINPALLPSLLAMMGWLAWRTWRTSRAAAVSGVLALILVFSAWPIRNAYRFHAFIPLRSTVGFELWMGNRPGSNGRLDDKLFLMFNQPERASYLAQGEVAYTQGKSRQAWDYIRAKPGIFVNISARRMYRFWSGTGNIDGSPLYALHALLTSVLGALGLLFLYRSRERAYAVLFALPLLLFPLPYYITHAEFRYRLNIDPVLTVLAAYAVTQLAMMISRRKSGSLPIR